jgi:hypothetical protein
MLYIRILCLYFIVMWSKHFIIEIEEGKKKSCQRLKLVQGQLVISEYCEKLCKNESYVINVWITDDNGDDICVW